MEGHPFNNNVPCYAKAADVFVDLGSKKSIESIGGSSHYTLIMHRDHTRYTWLLFLKQNSDAAEKFGEFLAAIRDHGTVARVRADDGGEFV